MKGKDAAQTLEVLTPSNIENLVLNSQRYSFLTNEQGGILAVIMVTHTGNALFVVIDAAVKNRI